MRLSIQKSAPQDKSADVLACGVFASQSSSESGASAPFKLPKDLASIDKKLGGQLQKTARSEGFKGQAGEVFHFHTHGKIKSKAILLVGLGAAESTSSDVYRTFGGNVVRAIRSKHRKAGLWVALDADSLASASQAIAEGVHLAMYDFAKYKTQGEPESKLNDLSILTDQKITQDLKAALTRAEDICSGVNLTRDLVNECAGVLNPTEFARIATETAKEVGLQIKVLSEKELKRENMGLMLAVNQAATPTNPPKLIRLSYKPAGQAKGKIALVGKGVTFDTGGLDIKPAAGMLDMKIDMAGAGSVLGAMYAIGKLKPDIAVTGYLGCVENSVGPGSYHPGDVITSRKGLTVEINNTDAEGRLVLADALDYAISTDSPDIIIDIATLTGACMVALGPNTAGLFSNSPQLAEAIESAAATTGEKFWKMPLADDLNGQLKSDIADTKNTGERFGGAITAALFLQKFVNKEVEWAHLDIAGPSSANGATAYTPKGGTGFCVRTLLQLVEDQAASR